MKRYGSPAELVQVEGDGWCDADGIALWRVGAVDGASLWGRVTRDHVDLGFAVVRGYLEAACPRGFCVVTDLSHVTSFDEGVYLRLAHYLGELGPRVAPQVREHTVILPDGVIGAAAAGMMHLRAAHAWQVAAELAAAIGDAPAGEIAAIVAPLREADLVGALRGQLAIAHTTTLARSARGLGVSTRTLQRALRGAGTSFRALVDEARISAACRLLDDSDLKIEAIAREVGFQSLSGFARSFRRIAGCSPQERRARVACGHRDGARGHRAA